MVRNTLKLCHYGVNLKFKLKILKVMKNGEN